jgi:hypothetical protein
MAEPAANVGVSSPTTPIMEQALETPVPVPVTADTAGTEPVGEEDSPGIELTPNVSAQEQEQEVQAPVADKEDDLKMPELVEQDPAEAESDDEAEDEEEEETPPP